MRTRRQECRIPRAVPGRRSAISTQEQSAHAGGTTGGSATAPAAGGHPDYRCTLANEATYLTWIHMSLGLLAGAVAADHLAVRGARIGLRNAACDAAVGLSAALVAFAYRRYRSVDRAMNEQRPLAPPRAGEVIVAAAAGLLVLTGVLCLQR
jgi:putative membrane protein